MNRNAVPTSFLIKVEAAPDITCKTIFNQTQELIVLINIQHGMAHAGYLETYDGGATHHWVYHRELPVRVVGRGLQYFENDLDCWRFFDHSVQEAYATFLLEKEIA